jgi:deoxyribose-phosphate aldolase
MITKEQFAKMQDHSVLEPFADETAVVNRINEAVAYGCGAVYVNPCYVKFAKERVAGTDVGVGTVIGFPFGANKTEIKIQEGLLAVEDGATELDVVINVSRLKSGDEAYVENELNKFVRAIREVSPSVLVKVIIETCYLTRDEMVRACEIVRDSGADYIKTSTGTGPEGCKYGDIIVMRRVCGDKVKIKAAHVKGSVENALAVIEAGASRIGDAMVIPWLQDFDKAF